MKLILAICFVLLSPPCFAEGRRVRVAANIPLSGDLALFGVPIQHGFSMAVDEIRSLPKPTEILVEWQDNRGQATAAAGIAAAQLANPTDVYISGLKPQTLAILDRVSPSGIPHFIWAWDTRIAQVAPNTFRTWLSFGLEASAIQAYSERAKPRRAGIVYVQIPGNTETHYRRVVEPSLRKAGATEVMIEPYSLGEMDFRSLVLKLRKFNADLLIINGFPHQLTSLVRNLRQLQMIKPGNTFASMDILDASPALSAAELDGIVTAAPRFLIDRSASYVAWLKKYGAKFPEAGTYHAAFSYDQAYAIYDASLRLPEKATPADWREALLATNRDGITGKIHFDDQGSLQVEAVPAMYRGGSLVRHRAAAALP